MTNKSRPRAQGTRFNVHDELYSLEEPVGIFVTGDVMGSYHAQGQDASIWRTPTREIVGNFTPNLETLTFGEAYEQDGLTPGCRPGKGVRWHGDSKGAPARTNAPPRSTCLPAAMPPLVIHRNAPSKVTSFVQWYREPRIRSRSNRHGRRNATQVKIFHTVG